MPEHTHTLFFFSLSLSHSTHPSAWLSSCTAHISIPLLFPSSSFYRCFISLCSCSHIFRLTPFLSPGLAKSPSPFTSPCRLGFLSIAAQEHQMPGMQPLTKSRPLPQQLQTLTPIRSVQSANQINEKKKKRRSKKQSKEGDIFFSYSFSPHIQRTHKLNTFLEIQFHWYSEAQFKVFPICHSGRFAICRPVLLPIHLVLQ